MTDREKIIEIIKKNGTYNGKSLSFDYYVVQPDDLADALIENDIGDIYQESLRLPPEFDLKQLYGAEEVEQIVKERDDYKYSNKVMTRALDILSGKFVKLKGYSSEILDLAESVTVNRALQQATREIEEERE